MREERRRATEVRGRGLRAGERRPARRQGERETQARTAETKQNPEEDTSTVAALDSRESGGRDDGNDGGTRAACDHSEDDESPAVGQTRIHAHEQKPTRRMYEGRWTWTQHFLRVICLLLLAAAPPTALGYFLGDTKAVLNGCEDHWTLPDRSAMPLLFQMTVCVDIRVVRPGAWVAFSYSSVYAPKPELGLEGDDGALYGWLLRVRHRFPLRLSPTVWHRVCLRRDVRRNSFSLEVDGAMVAERTVIAQAIAPSGSLRLGCRPRDRLFGAERGEVELYLFRMWADLGDHGLCEDGTVIGWDTRYWRFSSLNARQTDPNLLCGITTSFGRLFSPSTVPSITTTSSPVIATTDSHTRSSTQTNCYIGQLCSNTDAFFWMSLSAEAKKSSNINKEVKDLVSKALKCNRQPAKFLDFCQPDKKVEVVDVSCSAEEADGENSEKKAPRNATCGVLLKLSPAVSACELQRAGVIALQQAGNAKIRARITGEVERVGRNLCEDLKSPGGNFVRCKFTTSLDDFCQSSTHSSFNCSLLELNHHDPGQQPVTQSCSGEKSRFCDCTTFCNSSSQFFALRINIRSPIFDIDTIKRLLSLNDCNPVLGSCSDYSEISQQYKRTQLECNGITQSFYSCVVILEMSRPVNSCSLSKVVQRLIGSNSGITEESPLARMVLCGPPGYPVGTLLASNLTWVASDLLTSDVCPPDPTLLTCKANETLAVILTDSSCPEPPTTKQRTTQPPTTSKSTRSSEALAPTVSNNIRQTNTTTDKTTADHRKNESQGTAQPNMTTSPATVNSTQSSTAQPVLQTTSQNITVAVTDSTGLHYNGSDNKTSLTPSPTHTTTVYNVTTADGHIPFPINTTVYNITAAGLFTSSPNDTTLSTVTTVTSPTAVYNITAHNTTGHNVTTADTFTSSSPNDTTVYNLTTVIPSHNQTTQHSVTPAGTSRKQHNSTVTTANTTASPYTPLSSTIVYNVTATANYYTTASKNYTAEYNTTTVDNDRSPRTDAITTSDVSTSKTSPDHTIVYNVTKANNNSTLHNISTTEYNVTPAANNFTTASYNHTTEYNVTTAANNYTTGNNITTTTNNYTTASPNHTAQYNITKTTNNYSTASNSYTTNDTSVSSNHTTEYNLTTATINYTTASTNYTSGYNVTTIDNNITMGSKHYTTNYTSGYNVTTVTNHHTTVSKNYTTALNNSPTGYNITTATNNHKSASNNYTTWYNVTIATKNYTTASNNITTEYNVTTATNNYTTGSENYTTYFTTASPNYTTEYNATTVTNHHTTATNNHTTGYSVATAANNYTTGSNNYTTNYTTASPNYTTEYSVTTAASNYTTALNNNTTEHNMTTATNSYTTASKNNTTEYNVTIATNNYTTGSENYTTNFTTASPNYTTEYNVTTVTNHHTTATNNHTTGYSVTTAASNYTTGSNNYTTNYTTASPNYTTEYSVTTAASNYTTEYNVSTANNKNLENGTITTSNATVSTFTLSPNNTIVTTVSNNYTTVENLTTTTLSSNNMTAVPIRETLQNTTASYKNTTVSNTSPQVNETLNNATISIKNLTVNNNASVVDNSTKPTASPLNNRTKNRTTANATLSITTSIKNDTNSTIPATTIDPSATHNVTPGISYNQSSNTISSTAAVNLTTKDPGVNLTTTTPANAYLEHTSTISSTTPTAAATATTTFGPPPTQSSTTSADVSSTSTTTLQTTTLTRTTTTTSTATTISKTMMKTTIGQEAQEEQANELLNQTQDASQLNSSQVGQLVGQLEKLLDGPTVSQSVGQKAIGIISNLMDGDPAALSASANRLIRVVDSVGLRAVVSGDREILSSNSLVLAIRTVDGTNFPSTSVNIFNSDNVQIRALDRSRYKRSGSALGSVFLPSTLTAGLSPEQQQQASRVQFTFHTKNAFFQDKALDDKTLVSPVLGASVANLSISNLTENILFTIQNINPMPGNFVASCAFWDFTVNDGQGGWSSAGCFVVNATSDDTTCSCNHLTSFAILLVMY
uniref:GAIN-B domain-containing protein n=1 Tax=Scophthalmus maximus TaxID=52904 RepID=A0A8D3A3E6_SCOMX